MSNKRKPETVLALIADVQFADIDNMRVYGRMRYYKNTLNLLRSAINDLKEYEMINQVKVKHLLQVGDLIDGAKVKDPKVAISNMYKVLDELEKLFPKHDFESEYQFESETIPKLLHVYGNHEIHILGRKQIYNSPLNTARVLKQNQDEIGNYYYIDLTDRVRLICLDLYEISPLGYSKDNEVFKKSNEIIEYYKSLQQSASKQEEKDYYERYSIYNGAASPVQMKWLENQLDICKNTNKKVILAGHTPIIMQGENTSVAWNSDEILNLIWSHENLVCIYFSGHYHVGGYLVDTKGIHHLTLKAILETPPLNENNPNSYAVVEIFDDQISVNYPHVSSKIVINI
jgi:manganese-dependent ADP-ribose/CDP-alcohol diphosphatase